MRSRFFVLIAASLILGSAAVAHHAQGDVTSGTPVKWSGKITRVAWDGAHAMYWIEVADKDGIMVNQAIMASSPRVLNLRHIQKRDVKAGDRITVGGYLDSLTHYVSPVYFELADGRKLFPGLFPTDDQFTAKLAARLAASPAKTN